MRTTQKVLEVFSSIVDHNRTQAPTLATSSIFAKTPLTAQANRVLEVVIYTAMPLLSLGPFPKAISQQWCLCFFFFFCPSHAPGFHSEGCGSPGMSVSGGPALIAKAPRL